jgi:hypothetical protein
MTTINAASTQRANSIRLGIYNSVGQRASQKVFKITKRMVNIYGFPFQFKNASRWELGVQMALLQTDSQVLLGLGGLR